MDDLNTFAYLADDVARKLARPSSGVFAGVPVAVKDNIDVAGMPTGNGSALFATAPAAATDAPVVAQLIAAGATIVGKTHMTELACGTDGRNDYLGNARNPHNRDHHPGGSSSGSAIAVATGIVPVAIGSDTGGSIRVPAAACGVVGLKPTFGRVSTTGMSVGARPLDHIGPIAESVAVAATALTYMQRPDWARAPQQRPVSALRVGVLGGEFTDDCAADVIAAFDTAIAQIELLGATITDVELGVDLRETDAHANVLGRDLFDAFGEQIGAAPGDVGDELLHWHQLYGTVTSADYAAALDEQHRVTALVAHAQRDVDVLVCPTMRAAPSTIAQVANEPREVRTGNVALFNMTGQPSLTIPFGTAINGLPLGLLLTGRRGEDETVLSLGAALQVATAGANG